MTSISLGRKTMSAAAVTMATGAVMGTVTGLGAGIVANLNHMSQGTAGAAASLLVGGLSYHLLRRGGHTRMQALQGSAMATLGAAASGFVLASQVGA